MMIRSCCWLIWSNARLQRALVRGGGASPFVFLDQLAFEDFGRWALGQRLVADFDDSRILEGRDPVLAICLDLVFGGAAARLQIDDCLDLLAQLVVLDADDGRLGHGRML